MLFELGVIGRIWVMLLVVCIAGAVGGLVNALLTDGLIKPYKERNGEMKIYKPGYVGNIFTGAIAAGVSWGLYGPLSSFIIFSTSTETPQVPTFVGLTLSSFVGAVLIGVGGARWLTNESEKKILKLAAGSAEFAKNSIKEGS